MSSKIFRILLSLIIALYLGFGTFELGKFITADEHYWIYERIPAYFDALQASKWKKMLISDKPGVTLALVSGTVLFFSEHPEKHCQEQPDRTITCDTARSETLLTAFRLPILIVNALLLILLCLTLRRLTAERIALLTTLLMATSPTLLGISQISNPDALLWSTGALAFFAYLTWLKTEAKRYLLLASLALGFALLTKYAALVLLPFTLLALFLFFLFESPSEKTTLPKNLRYHLFTWFLFVLGALLVATLFLPTILTHPTFFFTSLAAGFPHFNTSSLWGVNFGLVLIFGDIFLNQARLFQMIRTLWLKHPYVLLRPFPLILLVLGLITVHHLFPHWDIFSSIPFDIKDLSNARYYTTPPNFWETILLEWTPLLFTLTPITLLGLLVAWFQASKKKTDIYRFEIILLSLIVLGYTLILIVANTLATPRYLILLYPLVALIAAIGLSYILTRLIKRYPFKLTHTLFWIIFFLITSLSLVFSRPYFLDYTNFLLPEERTLTDAWGQGGFAAATFLNQLPDAQHLTVWSDYYGVCEFFVGRCLTAYTFDPTLIRPDYYVLTRRGQIRFLSRADRWERLSGLRATDYYNRPDPDWQLLIHGNPENFIKVFRVHQE